MTGCDLRLTEEELESLEKLRSMPPDYRAAWMRMGIRLINGYPTVKAEALFWRDIAAAGQIGGAP